MKKILFSLLISINFVSADVNECMNDVYFANGIDTSKASAQDSIDKINNEFKASNPEAYKKVENWEVAYNHTHGIGADLYESMLQKMYHMTEIENRKTKGYLMFLLNLDSASGLFKYTFKGITKKIASKAPEEIVKTYAGKAAKQLAKKTLHAYNKKWGKDLTEEELELIFNEVFDYLIDKSVSSYIDKTRKEIEAEELADIKKHFEAYTNSIKDGHGTIVIAHSQGNLFTNMVHYNFEFTGQGWMKDYFSALGVASPANNILGESSPYITFDNDMIQLVPDSLPTNVTNPKRYFVKNALGEVIGETQYSVEAHSFLTSYMATDITKKTILDFIKEKIDIHKTRVSQWETDQESDKNTKDYKITVKHKFDPDNIIISDKIYPFNLDGKLYPVHRAYVKASCGGKNITESDDFWMIDNPEEERIGVKEQVAIFKYDKVSFSLFPRYVKPNFGWVYPLGEVRLVIFGFKNNQRTTIMIKNISFSTSNTLADLSWRLGNIYKSIYTRFNDEGYIFYEVENKENLILNNFNLEFNHYLGASGIGAGKPRIGTAHISVAINQEIIDTILGN